MEKHDQESPDFLLMWNVVGATGFEPATPCAQGRCATRLRYAPTLMILARRNSGGTGILIIPRDGLRRATRAYGPGKQRELCPSHGVNAG